MIRTSGTSGAPPPALLVTVVVAAAVVAATPRLSAQAMSSAGSTPAALQGQPVDAQPGPDSKRSPQPGSAVTISGSLRVRAESWSWFDAPPGESQYTFGGVLLRVAIHQRRAGFEWMLEGLSPWLAGLPTGAILPPPQGQLGLGASYFAANHGRNGSAVVRQAFLKFNGLLGDRASSIRFGRFEFSDGAEVMPKDPMLAALKGARIQQRLVGSFGFSHVGRGFDGVQYDRATARNHLTVFAARPTEGVFQLRSLDELDVDLLYGSFTRQLPSGRAPAEFRVFVLQYHDGRPVLKTDNRPRAVRAADHDGINITTLGGHYIGVLGTGGARTDLLLWGAAQLGSWGVLEHRAGAIAIEAGHRFALPTQPWLRVGYFLGTGDRDPNDGTHGSFFQVLPTPRIYARLPFFNLMNNRDLFAGLLVKPRSKTSVRADVHSLHLADSHDLWYLGGGPFQAGTFGYVGRPSNGRTALGTLFDGSLDYALTPRTTLTFYGGVVRGGAVEAAIYPEGGSHPILRFLYVEFLQRF